MTRIVYVIPKNPIDSRYIGKRNYYIEAREVISEMPKGLRLSIDYDRVKGIVYLHSKYVFFEHYDDALNHLSNDVYAVMNRIKKQLDAVADLHTDICLSIGTTPPAAM